MVSPYAQTRPVIKKFGLTELYSPPPEAKVLADVVFVHGLAGHPLETWCYGPYPGLEDNTRETISSGWTNRLPWLMWKREPETKEQGDVQQSKIERPLTGQGCYWPFDLLPEDFKDTRILTYGYNSAPAHLYSGETCQMNISAHSRNMLEQITDYRSKCINRPLIFVAHSLGGILVKDALVESKSNPQQHKQEIVKSCRNIFFFGTPHRGAPIASWLKYVVGSVRQLPGVPTIYDGILKDLEANREILNQIERKFNTILDEVPAEQRIKFCSFHEGQGFSGISWGDFKVVPSSSSSLNRDAFEDTRFLDDKNHTNMCSFKSRDDRGYEGFKASMDVFLDRIREKECESLHAKEISQQKERQDFIESLDYKGRCAREGFLLDVRAHDKTFQWLWKTPFVQWLSEDTPLSPQIFWICGKPASGKSVLMEHIQRSAEVRSRLTQATFEQWNIIYHFFDYGAGAGICNRFEGFLRSMLIQILPLGTSIIKAHNDGATSGTPNPPIQYLQDTLLSELRRTQKSIFLLLDGLDEYSEDLWELLDYLRQINSKRVRICVASRRNPIMDQVLRENPKLIMQEYNKAAIETFVDLKLQGSLLVSSLQSSNDVLELIKTIAEKADGVFLWAKFAIGEVALRWEEGYDLIAIEKRLDQVPPDLDKLYSRIFKRLPSDEMRQAAYLCQFVSFARRTLLVEELRAAMQEVSDRREFHIPLERFEKKILSLTGGLLEIVSNHEPYVVNHHRRKRQDQFLIHDDLQSPYTVDEGLRVVRNVTGQRTERLVKLTHRTVCTYLGSMDCREILRESHVQLPHPEVRWLQICAKQWDLDHSFLSPYGIALSHLAIRAGGFESRSQPKEWSQSNRNIIAGARFPCQADSREVDSNRNDFVPDDPDLDRSEQDESVPGDSDQDGSEQDEGVPGDSERVECIPGDSDQNDSEQDEYVPGDSDQNGSEQVESVLGDCGPDDLPDCCDGTHCNRYDSDRHQNTTPLLLQQYAALYMLDHAEGLEEKTEQSSYPIMRAGMTDLFLYSHQYLTTFVKKDCKCVLRTALRKGEMGYAYPTEAIHLAIAHNLRYYVRDALGEVAGKIRLNSPLWQASRSDGCIELESLQSLQCDNCDEINLLQYAIYAVENREYRMAVAKIHPLILTSIMKYEKQIGETAMINGSDQPASRGAQLLLKMQPCPGLNISPHQRRRMAEAWDQKNNILPGGRRPNLQFSDCQMCVKR